jgi:hypothetical protein
MVDPRSALPLTSFETTLSSLRETLESRPISEHELMLRREVRALVDRIASALSAAAAIEPDDALAARYASVSTSARKVAAVVPGDCCGH